VAISGGASASFQYDPFGRRVSKTIGGTTQYLYDGANPVQEISGSSASANLLAGGVDEYFQRTDSAGARHFLTDALGSTLALADSTGALQTQYTFEPFGNTTVTGASTTNTFAFTGRELDAAGLYFYRARYYSPGLQRFISEDPVGFRGGINKYAYVSNSPTNFNDPFGLDKKGFFDWDRTKDVNRCAASLSQELALNKLPFVPNVVGSNTWGDIAGLVTGPEPGTDPAVAGSEAFDRKAAVTFDATAHFALVPAILKLATRWDLVSEAPTGLLTFTPETIGSLVVPVVNVSVAAAAEAVLAGKLLWDAGVYVGALAVCNKQ
jgi:RHS repeat-associated protein